MRMVLRIWRITLTALAGIAGAIIGAMFVFIVLDVGLRTFGARPPQWTATFIEFGLLYAAMLAAPWLISRDGHIRVRALTDRLSAKALAPLERGIFSVLSLLCVVMASFGVVVLLDTIARGEVEIRSVILPRWVLFAPIAPAFALMAIEFARLAAMGTADRSGAEDAERSL